MDILLIEQHEEFFKIMENVLKTIGNVDSFTNFNKCMKKINFKAENSQLYDLALIDLDMPDIMGIKILNRLRTLESEAGKKPIKILMFSEDKNINLIMNFFTIKDDVFLIKPKNEKVFKEYISDLLK